MRACRTLGELVFVAIALVGTRVNALEFAAANLELVDSNRSDCPATDTLVVAVEQRLQRPVFMERARADVLARVTYAGNPGNWSAAIELSTAQGESLGRRRITSQGEECSSVADTLALVLALMLDLSKEDVRARTAAVAPKQTTAVHLATQPSVPERERPSTLLALRAVAGLGQLPSLAWGTSLAGNMRLGHALAIELEMTAHWPVSIDDGAANRARFSLYQAALGVCAEGMHHARHELWFCAGPEVGLLRAEGIGYVTSRSAQSALVGPFLRAVSTWWPGSRLGVQVALGATASFRRDRFYATRSDGSTATLFQAAVLAPQLHVGICLAL